MSSSPSALIETFHRLHVVKYLTASSGVLLVYDYLLTFSDEVIFFWSSPWNVGKVLFLLTRYMPMVEAILTYFNQLGTSVSVSTCELLFNITGWMFIFNTCIAEAILMLRVWALWNRSKRVAAFFTILSMTCIVLAAVLFIKFHGSQRFLDQPRVVALPGCYPISADKIIVVAYILLMVFESVILGLMLTKGVRHYRTSSSSFIRAMLQDGVVYFVTLMSVSFINAIVFIAAAPEMANILTPMQRSLHSMLSARILMRMRKEATRTSDSTMSTSLPLNTLSFATVTQDPESHSPVGGTGGS
ncbi:hypothetical protein HGRIS_009104 [Hohenbuehelia grisea]|uniref:DUF6533 domain-containing protein n=1 Tax=Hohenbuehelia grisea TaxID=104357 RepID=A0ABR3J0J4_9AGAR